MPIGNYERLYFSLWDTAHLQPGFFRKHTMFRYPVGEQGKTLTDTNMVMRESLPHSQAFVCRRLRLSLEDSRSGYPVSFAPDLTPSQQSFLRNCTVSFSIERKLYWQGLASGLWFENQLIQRLLQWMSTHEADPSMSRDFPSLAADLTDATQTGSLKHTPDAPFEPTSKQLEQILSHGLNATGIQPGATFNVLLDCDSECLLQEHISVRVYLEGFLFRTVQ